MEFVNDIHLQRSAERGPPIEALSRRLGARVGIPGVLEGLNRQATHADVPGSAAKHGFTWNDQDRESPLWWPQGISTTADASGTEALNGRSLLVTSWYCKGIRGGRQGSRVTFVDLETLRYRHVLIVEAETNLWGRVRLKPLHIHAGGVVWAGDYLHLAGTRKGIFTARVEDIIRLEPSDKTFDYRYVLPVRFAYSAHSATDVEQLRYSFLSLNRSADPPELIVGEYGRDDMSTRIVRYPMHPQSLLLHRGDDGASRPIFMDSGGVGHMQGVTVVDDRYYVTASRGKTKNGDVYVGQPGDFHTRSGVLPPGPEDITYWPSRDQLFSLSEYPGARFVFAMDRNRFD